MIRRFINWLIGECYCEQPEPLQIAAEAGICNRCKRRLWGEDFNHWL
jgi:hypothetical protein